MRLLLILDHATEDRLLADIVEHGHTVVARLLSSREAEARLPDLEVDVVLAGAGRSTLSADLLRATDSRGIRVVALASTDLDRHHARSLGIHEVLEADVAWGEIDAFVRGSAVLGARVDETAEAAHPRGARVIAVWGPAGAPGRTTLSINVAAELAARGRDVVLIDADTYGGAIAPALGLLDEAPGFASACRLAGSGSLDRAEFDRIAPVYSAAGGPFRVLTGIPTSRRWPELAPDRIDAAIEVLRTVATDIVIDVGFNLEADDELSSDLFSPRRNAATAASLRLADDVLAVGLADPIGLARFLRAHVDLLDVVSTSRVHVVINRVRGSALGIDAAGQVRQSLRRFAGIETATLLPHDQRASDAAILLARTLREAAPRSGLRAGIRGLVDTVLLPIAADDLAVRPRRALRRSLAAG
ncbi:AAA family ATPase [Agromyces atrinae]|uniref:MinD-like ATPase involved in chromosome partitioning or flagellar assembly n=1 Tax=Agromyces atrinae TaxID=592376 RepID=A0A4Q2MDY5_9MICO|nr:regulator [Agromyces atrinae]NYD66633.1 MinD-like ATPase involved in chromosome partitioning or flagellar assembly [Agromyces atrinae]RXZ87300.1 regulator [Agromyces atrinae]